MKFSDYLMAMEIENGYLSSGAAANRLPPILQQVLNELNVKGNSCCVITKCSQMQKLYIIYMHRRMPIN